MGYTVASIDKLQKRLETLPEIQDDEREMTKQEAIRRMADTIVSLQHRGYTMEKIAEIMTTEGMAISVQTLKSYLTRAKKPARAKPRRKEASGSNTVLRISNAKEKKSSGTPTAQSSGNTKGGTPTMTSSSFVPRHDTEEL